ncbi:MAG: outer membrane protein assembly factor BamD [Acidiferrobacteraceae bacterium]
MIHDARKVPAVLLCLMLLAGCASTGAAKRKDWTARQFYVSGRKALLADNYTRAIRRFETLEARYPYGTYATRAQLAVAYAYYKNRESDSAVAAADRFIRLHPTDPHVDYAYYLKGLANFNAHRSTVYRLFGKNNLRDRDARNAKQAIAAFRVLVRRYPHSRYASDAYHRLVYLTDLLARDQVDVAHYYYSRRAFVAAVNRAQYVIEHYQQTPAVEEALAIEAMAYRRMGLARLSDASLSVLQRNFPHSRYIRKIERIPEPKPPAPATGIR